MISCTAYGMSSAFKLYKRSEQLLTMQKAVGEIKDTIKYSRTESCEIITHIKNKYTELFRGELNIKDALIIKNLFSGLGKTDTNGQLDFCDSVLNDINRNLLEAEKDKNEKAKLYSTLGVSAGLAISIIIF